MNVATAPEPDRLDGAPHPRETRVLYGQDAAQADLLAAWNAGRFHQGWMLAGPRGIGKATLAWRLARFLLTDPPARAATLDPSPDHPALPRIQAQADPGLLVLRRPVNDRTGRLQTVITGEAARRLGPFFGLSAGGRRVVIVDAADELNPTAANAILKLLEEPPRDATLLLVAHQPARLLPTIRSRCRMLPLRTLGPADLARAVAQAGGPSDVGGLAELAQGSVGGALALADEGAAIYATLVGLFGSGPMDAAAARRLAESCTGANRLDRAALILEMIQRLLHRLARAGLRGPGAEAAPGEAAMLARLAPHDAAARGWAALAQDLQAKAAHGMGVNVDPAALIWDQLAAIDAQARRV